MRAACVGNTVEWYDFAIFGSLGVVITPVFFPAEDSTSVLLATFAVYATAFLMRPLGAILFGRIGDMRGRKVVFSTVLLLMTGATAAVAVLPGYARIGVAASVAVVVLRALQGLAAGGEGGLAAVFMAEHAMPGRRGVTAAWQIATQGFGLALGFGAGAALITLLPAAEHPSWWRIAFLLAVPLGLIGFYLRRSSLESPHYEALAREASTVSSPVRVVWRDHRRGMGAGFVLAGTGGLALNTFFVFLPNHLVATTDRTLPSALMGAVVGLVSMGVAALLLGRLSDRVGRRPVVLSSLVALAAISPPLLWAAKTAGSTVFLMSEAAAGVAIGGVLSVAMVAEMFPTEVRVTGLALTAGLASAMLGGTAPLISQLLVTTTDFGLAPAVYISSAALVALLVLRGWRETAFDAFGPRTPDTPRTAPYTPSR